jgi:hypothetical protein
LVGRDDASSIWSIRKDHNRLDQIVDEHTPAAFTRHRGLGAPCPDFGTWDTSS